MKKSVVVTVLILFTMSMVLIAAGCSGAESKKSPEEIYMESMNHALVSFTDCANEFSDSLERIAASKSAPSDSQIKATDESLAKLEKACRTIGGIDAPAQYAGVQQSMNDAMADYGVAFEKCRVLLDFYRNYDERFHEFSDPVEGSSQMRKEGTALYEDFAQAMMTAIDSFRAAVNQFESVN